MNASPDQNPPQPGLAGQTPTQGDPAAAERQRILRLFEVLRDPIRIALESGVDGKCVVLG